MKIPQKSQIKPFFSVLGAKITVYRLELHLSLIEPLHALGEKKIEAHLCHLRGQDE